MKKFIRISLCVVSLVFGLSLMGGVVLAVKTGCQSSVPGSTVTINCPGGTEVNTGSEGKKPKDIVTNIIGYVMYAVGVLSVIIIILGGINYATAAGDETKVTKAKKTITGAIIGLAFAILASVIIEFVKRQIG